MKTIQDDEAFLLHGFLEENWSDFQSFLEERDEDESTGDDIIESLAD